MKTFKRVKKTMRKKWIGNSYMKMKKWIFLKGFLLQPGIRISMWKSYLEFLISFCIFLCINLESGSEIILCENAHNSMQQKYYEVKFLLKVNSFDISSIPNLIQKIKNIFLPFFNKEKYQKLREQSDKIK
jgi:hypothetical protein